MGAQERVPLEQQDLSGRRETRAPAGSRVGAGPRVPQHRRRGVPLRCQGGARQRSQMDWTLLAVLPSSLARRLRWGRLGGASGLSEVGEVEGNILTRAVYGRGRGTDVLL